jgi:ribose transport system ATP-binding protein
MLPDVSRANWLTTPCEGEISGAMEIFRISGIRKSFGAVRALQWDESDSCTIETGQVWAFAGENGAGKSTLAAILAGVTSADAGTVTLCGQAYAPSSVVKARALGVQIVFQEPALVPSLTIAENLLLGREAEFRRFGLRRHGLMNRQARRLLADICPHIDPRTVARDLALEDQKLVETARAVSTKPRCIIFDETTAAMSSRNTRLLLDLIARLKPDTAIIVVTHRTEEIFEITDKLLILKDGRFVAAKDTEKTTPDELSNLMVGREVNLHLREEAPSPESGQPLLDVSGLTVKDGISDFSLRLDRGRIIGIGGLAGAGQERILRSLYGIDKASAGAILVKGSAYEARSPRRSIRRGMLYSPKNRDREGLILQQKVRENAVLSILGRLSRAGLASKRRETNVSVALQQQLNIKCRTVEESCRNLSGGNRQKVVLAKLLATEGDIFLLDNPTRGIDIGARAEIYRLMNDLTAKGCGIVMVSDELQELLQMSDDIVLIRDGKVSKTFKRRDNPQESDLIRHMI